MNKKVNELYIVHTSFGRGAFGFTEDKSDYFYSFCPKDKFVPWVAKLIKDHPDYRIRCVINEGITRWLELRKEQDDLFAKKIVMNFQEER